MCDERELSRYLERKILDLIHKVELQKIQCARIEDAVDHMKKDGSPEDDDPGEKADLILRSVEKRTRSPIVYQGEERRRRSSSQQ